MGLNWKQWPPNVLVLVDTIELVVTPRQQRFLRVLVYSGRGDTLGMCSGDHVNGCQLTVAKSDSPGTVLR